MEDSIQPRYEDTVIASCRIGKIPTDVLVDEYAVFFVIEPCGTDSALLTFYGSGEERFRDDLIPVPDCNRGRKVSFSYSGGKGRF